MVTMLMWAWRSGLVEFAAKYRSGADDPGRADEWWGGQWCDFAALGGADVELSVARTWSSRWRGRGAPGGAEVELQVARRGSYRWRGAGAPGRAGATAPRRPGAVAW